MNHAGCYWLNQGYECAASLLAGCWALPSWRSRTEFDFPGDLPGFLFLIFFLLLCLVCALFTFQPKFPTFNQKSRRSPQVPTPDVHPKSRHPTFTPSPDVRCSPKFPTYIPTPDVPPRSPPSPDTRRPDVHPKPRRSPPSPGVRLTPPCLPFPLPVHHDGGR
jgi:hypothetical protein